MRYLFVHDLFEDRLSMVITRGALRDKLFRDAVMSTTDAVTLFDAGAGQVSIEKMTPHTAVVLIKNWEAVPRW